MQQTSKRFAAHRTSDGIAWRDAGPASPATLVVCHGLALDHRDLADLLEPLAARWRIVVWDMPGHGASAAMPAAPTLSSMTDALESVLDAAAIETMVLIGFSFGGMIAQELVKRRRRYVAAFVAFGCFAPFLTPPPMTPAEVDALAAAIESMPWAEVRASFAAACSVRTDIQQRLASSIDRVGAIGLAAMTRALFSSFEPDPAFRLEVPLLALRGADDANGAALAAATTALVAAADHATEVIIPDAGHCAYLDQPAAVMAAITAFLTRLGDLNPIDATAAR